MVKTSPFKIRRNAKTLSIICWHSIKKKSFSFSISIHEIFLRIIIDQINRLKSLWLILFGPLRVIRALAFALGPLSVQKESWVCLEHIFPGEHFLQMRRKWRGSKSTELSRVQSLNRFLDWVADCFWSSIISSLMMSSNINVYRAWQGPWHFVRRLLIHLMVNVT